MLEIDLVSTKPNHICVVDKMLRIWLCMEPFNVRHRIFVKDFTLSETNEVHVIVKVTFFETHMVDVRRKPMCLRCVMMCHDGKDLNFKLTRTPMVGGTKFNLVLMDPKNIGKHNGCGSSGAIQKNS